MTASRLTTAALTAAIAAVAASPAQIGAIPQKKKTQKRYYDPGVTPQRASRRGRAGKATIAVFTRQLVRSIRRELTEHSFARARLQANSLGFPIEPPRGKVPLDESTWRKIWLAQLETAIAGSKKQAEVPHA